MTGHTKDFPGFDNLFKMQEQALGNRCFYADLEDHPVHFELLRGEWIPDAPLQTHWSMGRGEPEAIARGRGVSWFYMSSRVQQLFHDYKLTGWSTYAIVLHNKAGEICPGYAGLSITGRCGPIDQDRAEQVPDHLRKPGTPDLMGMYFDESTWDGSDFFCPAGVNAYMFTTEAVKGLFEEHNIPGFRFTPLTKAMWYP